MSKYYTNISFKYQQKCTCSNSSISLITNWSNSKTACYIVWCTGTCWCNEIWDMDKICNKTVNV